MQDASRHDEAISLLEKMLDGYRNWIMKLESESCELSDEHSETASIHILKCRAAYERMQSGFKSTLHPFVCSTTFKNVYGGCF